MFDERERITPVKLHGNDGVTVRVVHKSRVDINRNTTRRIYNITTLTSTWAAWAEYLHMSWRTIQGGSDFFRNSHSGGGLRIIKLCVVH